ncbi:MAG: 50S ribosomal protein L25 [Deltaproteobacteria bacterium]|nr:50S ribosomal protein L25 [Deltaproteobacteria bacterium]
MELPVISVRERPVKGKGSARKIRALGHIPAVLYGLGKENRSLVVEPSQLVDILTSSLGSNSVMKLEFVDGNKDDSCLAMIKDHDVHPFRRNLLHCDFIRIDENNPPNFEVPIRVVGKSEGEKVGAKLNIQVRSVLIKCPIDALPDAITIDVSPLDVGDKLMISDLEYPEGAEPIATKDMPVVTVRMGRVEKEDVGAEEVEGEEGAAEGEGAAAGEGAEPAAEDGKAESPTPEK